MTLTPPFPYFGSKRQAAGPVWDHLGDPYVYIEPFAGSLAVLLARPGTDHPYEIAVDYDGLIVNVWRAIQQAPTELLRLDRGPVSEVEIDAWHRRLIVMRPTLTALLRTDPTYCDLELARMWWAGMCSWIGSGWCSADAPLNASRQRPHIDRTLKGLYSEGLTDDRIVALSARLSNVILLAGDWSDAWRKAVTDSIIKRYLSSKTSTIGVFLDPPYTKNTGRSVLYGDNDGALSDEVQGWAIQHASPRTRIVVAGYRSEYPGLVAANWNIVDWSRPSGYVNDSGNDRRDDDVLFCSPNATIKKEN